MYVCQLLSAAYAIMPCMPSGALSQSFSAAHVKVTTYEEMSRDTFLEAGRPVCDLRLYPSGQLS